MNNQPQKRAKTGWERREWWFLFVFCVLIFAASLFWFYNLLNFWLSFFSAAWHQSWSVVDFLSLKYFFSQIVSKKLFSVLTDFNYYWYAPFQPSINFLSISQIVSHYFFKCRTEISPSHFCSTSFPTTQHNSIFSRKLQPSLFYYHPHLGTYDKFHYSYDLLFSCYYHTICSCYYSYYYHFASLIVILHTKWAPSFSCVTTLDV